jgi:hypothetical protein
VDGKHGSDNNGGRSWNDAYKTINFAARRVPGGSAAAGWTVLVRGYADYIYRERPVLTKGEAGITAHRRWAQQFYS